MSTFADTVTELVTTPQIDDGDHERFTHIVLEGYTPDEEDAEFVPIGNSVVEGIINASAVKALCGKVWVPGRDPRKYPICPTCREIAESMGWNVPQG